MTSQGQRFRRRALRRGYKVDEVDAFLDRVEATLAGDPAGAPVTAQEVHDVVFRVRFGGYDEWQVDLHLDRVERQLAEMEERGTVYGRGGGEPRAPQRMGPPERMAPPERPMPGERPVPPDRMPPPELVGPPPGPAAPGPGGPGPAMAGRAGPPAPGPQGPPPRGRFDEPPYGPGRDEGYEPGRRGRPDMTAERRMSGDPTIGGGGPPGSMPPVRGGPPPGTPPLAAPPPGVSMAASAPPPMAPPAGAGPAVSPGDVQRIDQLRRTFQLRRFGSGYDRAQVDRLFDGLIAGLSGRGPLPSSDADLDPAQFELVPGGYFEAEVDGALKEVRDILARRR